MAAASALICEFFNENFHFHVCVVVIGRGGVFQVSLTAEVLKGNSIRKALVREAKTHGASTVIVGITRHRALG